nr:hypothetical protein BaRGS_002223 [Batillaria attramentaria]
MGRVDFLRRRTRLRQTTQWKDNKAVKDVRVVGGFSTKIEVECRSLEEAVEAVEAGSDVIMLDNFAPQALAKTAADLKERYPKVIIEASGGITEDNLAQYSLRILS